MEYATTITKKGQVVIPVFYRKKLGILPGRKIKFQFDEKTKRLTVTPIENFLSFKGTLKSRKKYSKEKARKLFIKDLLKGKV